MLAEVDKGTNHCQLARLSLGERQEVWLLLLDVLEGRVLVETGNARWRGSGKSAGNNMANWCWRKSQEGPEMHWRWCSPEGHRQLGRSWIGGCSPHAQSLLD